MIISHHSTYRYEVPVGHRFPMMKYELLYEQLLYEGTIVPSQVYSPVMVSEEIILLTHEAAYWSKLRDQTLSEKEARAIGLPMSQQLIERSRYIADGTLKCAIHALEHGIGLNTAGGTHHAHTNQGGGFCLLNDQAIATNYLLHHGLASRVLIVDLDAHQGDGTAQIFRDEPRVFTFSMHGDKNYPFRKQISDLDLPLPDGITDLLYLELLAKTLPTLIRDFCPDFVCYLAGVDVLASDKLGRLALTHQGCLQRDEYVLSICKNANLPVVVSMGGGYSDQLKTIVEAHANTFRVAASLFL